MVFNSVTNRRNKIWNFNINRVVYAKINQVYWTIHSSVDGNTGSVKKRSALKKNACSWWEVLFAVTHIRLI